MIVVSNATPLIGLASIGRFDVLKLDCCRPSNRSWSDYINTDSASVGGSLIRYRSKQGSNRPAASINDPQPDDHLYTSGQHYDLMWPDVTDLPFWLAQTQ